MCMDAQQKWGWRKKERKSMKGNREKGKLNEREERRENEKKGKKSQKGKDEDIGEKEGN